MISVVWRLQMKVMAILKRVCWGRGVKLKDLSLRAVQRPES